MNCFSVQVIFLIILILVPCLVSAQTTYNSPYSVDGIGIMMNRSSSLNRGMALTGIGVQDTSNLNHTNPASYVSVSKPFSKIFEIGTYGEVNSYETNLTRESKSAGGITNLSYWFKLSPTWASVLGLSPFSGMSYRIKATRQLGTIEDANYLYEGSGNISALHFGNAVKVTRNLSVGFNVSYLFGTLEKSETVESVDFTKLTYVSKVFANKADIDIGLQYRFRWNKKYVAAGIVADNGFAVNGTRTGNLFTQTGDTLASMLANTVRYKLPPHVGVGLSMRSKYSTLAVDAKLTAWKKASFPEASSNFNNSWRISAGYVYGGNPHGEKFLSFVSLRAGVFYENYYRTLNNKNFSNTGLSAGVSIPVFDGKSAINFTYAANRFGTVSNGLILQRTNQFMIDVVIRDIWGVRRRLE